MGDAARNAPGRSRGGVAPASLNGNRDGAAPFPRQHDRHQGRGSLATIPQALDRVCAELTRASQDHRLLVVPAAGLCRTVRSSSARRDVRRCGSLDGRSWPWINTPTCSPSEYRVPSLVEEPGAHSGGDARAGGGAGAVPLDALSRRAPPQLGGNQRQHRGLRGGALDAARLILIKPAAAGEAVDPYFTTTLPAGMPYWIVGCDRMDELVARLSE